MWLLNAVTLIVLIDKTFLLYVPVISTTNSNLQNETLVENVTVNNNINLNNHHNNSTLPQEDTVVKNSSSQYNELLHNPSQFKANLEENNHQIALKNASIASLSVRSANSDIESLAEQASNDILSNVNTKKQSMLENKYNKSTESLTESSLESQIKNDVQEQIQKDMSFETSVKEVFDGVPEGARETFEQDVLGPNFQNEKIDFVAKDDKKIEIDLNEDSDKITNENIESEGLKLVNSSRSYKKIDEPTDMEISVNFEVSEGTTEQTIDLKNIEGKPGNDTFINDFSVKINENNMNSQSTEKNIESEGLRLVNRSRSYKKFDEPTDMEVPVNFETSEGTTEQIIDLKNIEEKPGNDTLINDSSVKINESNMNSQSTEKNEYRNSTQSNVIKSGEVESDVLKQTSDENSKNDKIKDNYDYDQMETVHRFQYIENVENRHGAESVIEQNEDIKKRAEILRSSDFKETNFDLLDSLEDKNTDINKYMDEKSNFNKVLANSNETNKNLELEFQNEQIFVDNSRKTTNNLETILKQTSIDQEIENQKNKEVWTKEILKDDKNENKTNYKKPIRIASNKNSLPAPISFPQSGLQLSEIHRSIHGNKSVDVKNTSDVPLMFPDSSIKVPVFSAFSYSSSNLSEFPLRKQQKYQKEQPQIENFVSNSNQFVESKMHLEKNMEEYDMETKSEQSIIQNENHDFNKDRKNDDEVLPLEATYLKNEEPTTIKSFGNIDNTDEMITDDLSISNIFNQNEDNYFKKDSRMIDNENNLDSKNEKETITQTANDIIEESTTVKMPNNRANEEVATEISNFSIQLTTPEIYNESMEENYLGTGNYVANVFGQSSNENPLESSNNLHVYEVSTENDMPQVNKEKQDLTKAMIESSTETLEDKNSDLLSGNDVEDNESNSDEILSKSRKIENSNLLLVENNKENFDESEENSAYTTKKPFFNISEKIKEIADSSIENNVSENDEDNISAEIVLTTQKPSTDKNSEQHKDDSSSEENNSIEFKDFQQNIIILTTTTLTNLFQFLDKQIQTKEIPNSMLMDSLDESKELFSSSRVNQGRSLSDDNEFSNHNDQILQINEPKFMTEVVYSDEINIPDHTVIKRPGVKTDDEEIPKGFKPIENDSFQLTNKFSRNNFQHDSVEENSDTIVEKGRQLASIEEDVQTTVVETLFEAAELTTDISRQMSSFHSSSEKNFNISMENFENTTTENIAKLVRDDLDQVKQAGIVEEFINDKKELNSVNPAVIVFISLSVFILILSIAIYVFFKIKRNGIAMDIQMEAQPDKHNNCDDAEFEYNHNCHQEDKQNPAPTEITDNNDKMQIKNDVDDNDDTTTAHQKISSSPEQQSSKVNNDEVENNCDKLP